MIRQTIITKYLGPSNFKGSRIKATASAGSKTISYDHALRTDECHAKAAQELARSKGWYGTWIAGGMMNGNAFVMLPGDGNDVVAESLSEDGFSLPNPHNATAQDLFDFATNTGDFYERHCEMAKDKCDHIDWHLRVNSLIRNRYAKEINRFANVPHSVAVEAATMLRDYYAEHVTEI